MNPTHNSRRQRTLRWIEVAQAGCGAALCSALVAAQVPRASRLAGLEPAWATDTSIATSRAAREELQRGDKLWSALPAHPASAEALAPTFEAWRRAVALTEPGELVEGSAPSALDPHADPARDAPRGTERSTESTATARAAGFASALARRVESVEIAVMRRVGSLDAAEQRAWSDRYAPAAEDARIAAYPNERGLARVERDWPATPAAARAALALGDPWFERGEFELARAAWKRAREHVRPLAPSPSGASTLPSELCSQIEAALARRLALLPQTLEARAARDSAAPSLANADALELVAEIAIAPTPRRLGPGLVPGIAVLDDGTALFQSGEIVATLSASGVSTPIDITTLAEAAHVGWHPAFRDRDGVWKQQPAVSGTTAVLVLGRAREQAGNALICLENVTTTPRVRWAWSAKTVTSTDGTAVALETLLGAGLSEFQPGPCIVGGQVLVHVRQFGRDSNAVSSMGVDEAQIEARLAAIDLASGALRWIVTLAKGSDGRAGERERMLGGLGVTLPPPPLEPALGGRSVFVDTGLALGFAIDALDGRVLYGVRVPREDDAANARPFLGPLDASDDGWRWRPQGADGFVYALTSHADLDGSGIFRAAPIQPLALIELARGGAAGALVGFATTLPGRFAPATWATLDAEPRSNVSSPRARAGARAIVHSGHRALAVAGGEVALYELFQRSTLLAALRLPTLDYEPEVALEVSGDIVRIVGRQRSWVVRLR